MWDAVTAILVSVAAASTGYWAGRRNGYAAAIRDSLAAARRVAQIEGKPPPRVVNTDGREVMVRTKPSSMRRARWTSGANNENRW